MSKFRIEGNTLFAEGDLDTPDIEEFEKTAMSLVEATDGAIVFDFTRVEYMPSSLLGMLMSLRGRVTAEGRTFRLRPSPMVRQLLTLTGMISSITLDE